MTTLTTFQIPDISQYIKYIYTTQVTSEITLVFMFKTQFRSDDVFVDIYKDDISTSQKLISSVKLTADSIMCLPKYDIGINATIRCYDQDRVNTSIKKSNAHEFYIQIDLEE